ncbi:hypothetical protein INT44_004284 [Umbelopsis vinacea]|uniref:Uncharacterized protein n=1 Tax=Umbelopsis vinacea TaxID=44442 RepID=A0A8H7UPC4_9FUNG|nr:hypothetical protein INT44_004284 [Umbelopsis vinacea]
MSHMHSALHIFDFLQQIQSSISEADFDILLAELSSSDFIPDKQAPSQFTVSIAHEIPHPLIAELKDISTTAMAKPTFHSMLKRIADGYNLLEKVASVLKEDYLIADFIEAMRIGDPYATPQEVTASVNAFVESLEPPALQDEVNSILDSKRCENSMALNYPQLVEAHNIIHDEVVYQRFVELLEDCAMEGSLWPQIIARIYELIQSQRPQVWEQLGLLLDRVSRTDDKPTNSNREEFVKRNFFDSGGRQELDADIDRARMEHTLGL